MIQRLIESLRQSVDGRDLAPHTRAEKLSPRGGTIAGLRIDAVWPVRPASGGSALNKDGQLVLAGQMGEAPVKIYEARSTAHAMFIQAVSRHPTAGQLVAKVLAVDGSLVVAEWIEGQRMTGGVDRIVEIQERLHAAAVTGLPPTGFDYWHDYIEPRFLRALNVLGRSAVSVATLPEVRRLWSEGPPTLMNPDVTPDNLLIDAAGCLRIVDSGDLTVGGLPLLDVVNTAQALPREQRADYVSRYLAGRPLPPTSDHVRALNAAWLARAVGADYVAGRLNSADAMLDAFSSGRSVLPVELGEGRS